MTATFEIVRVRVAIIKAVQTGPAMSTAGVVGALPADEEEHEWSPHVLWIQVSVHGMR